MRRLGFGAAALGSAWLLSAPAVAAQLAAPGAAQIALGRRLAQAGDFAAIADVAARLELDEIVEQSAGLTAAERERLRAIGTARIAELRGTMLERVGEVYARRFPPDQLAAIVAFYESEAGRNYISSLPDLVPQLAEAMEGTDLAGNVRRAFCRETGKLCHGAR